MAKPISTIQTGKPGRPATVKLQVIRAVSDILFNALHTSDLIAAVVPQATIKTEAKKLAEQVWADLEKSDFRVIPARVCHELALLVGEPAPASQSIAPTVGVKQETA